MLIGTFYRKHRSGLRFLLLAGLLVAYGAYLSQAYGFRTGGLAAALTWSFFVLCTPVADGGFLLDFPLRLLFGIEMVISEIFVWAIAIILNVVAIYFFPEIYDTTTLTRLFHVILTTPWPYWSVIALSGLGTFLSLRFGDEILTMIFQRQKSPALRRAFWKKLAAMASVFALILFGYYEALHKLGIDLPGA